MLLKVCITVLDIFLVSVHLTPQKINSVLLNVTLVNQLCLIHRNVFSFHEYLYFHSLLLELRILQYIYIYTIPIY